MNYLLIVLQIANFSQNKLIHLLLAELSHTKMKNCEYLRKAMSFALMLGGRYTPQAVVLTKNFVSPKMVAILNFQSFCKTQKCLYLENRAIWSELNKILDLLGISAE